jgi:vacuolar-type H+-ATPase subunit H
LRHFGQDDADQRARAAHPEKPRPLQKGERTVLIRPLQFPLVLIAAVAVLSLAGCNKTPAETSKDVTEAREKASQEVGEARQDASQAEAKAEEKVVDARQAYAKTDASARANVTEIEADAIAAMAKADFDVAIAEAKGRYNIGTKKCGVLGGVEKNACLSTADAAFKAEEAIAIADRDATLVAAALASGE